MIKDLLISFKENFNEKVKNPFLGSYVLVWIVRNWVLIYSLFNFKDDLTLAKRIEYIKTYFSNNEFLPNLFSNILWTFGLLLITYILLNLSRFIVNFSEKRIKPLVYKITDSNSIVLKTEYNRLQSLNEELQKRLELERELRSKVESRHKKLEEAVTENSLFSKESDENNISDVTSILLNKLREEDKLEEFKKTAVNIKEGIYIKNDYKPQELFKQLGLIIYDGSKTSSDKRYKLTQDGEDVFLKSRLI
ncbi:hypothetical protein [Algibacter sp. L3A6]|uniref:hypothetical protein n=1 Tax=Algibacter sp. L3A6 TaxID=2686366 RepID=UPI00131B77E3|nr:hypothetical protein [Algibacter sp. L3A6]